jgi:hypothetical protein
VNETLKPVIKAARNEEVHLLFMDAAHLYYNHSFVVCGVLPGYL